MTLDAGAPRSAGHVDDRGASLLVEPQLQERLRWSLRSWKRRLRLARADVVIVSHAKSGRTWLCALISHVYHQRYGIDERLLVNFDNFQRLQPAVPRILFTHDSRKVPAGAPLAPLRSYRGKRVILLVRDPRDVAVSAYFQKRRHASRLRTPPKEGGEVDGAELLHFVRGKLPLVLRFLRRWHERAGQLENVLLLRYEDLRARPDWELARVMAFIGEPCSPEELRRAVAFASFERLRSREASGFFASDILRPGDPADGHSFKVRRGKVGGYRDYFTPDELREIDAAVADDAMAQLGYETACGSLQADAGLPARC